MDERDTEPIGFILKRKGRGPIDLPLRDESPAGDPMTVAKLGGGSVLRVVHRENDLDPEERPHYCASHETADGRTVFELTCPGKATFAKLLAAYVDGIGTNGREAPGPWA